jgi:hypothetical protein
VTVFKGRNEQQEMIACHFNGRGHQNRAREVMQCSDGFIDRSEQQEMTAGHFNGRGHQNRAREVVQCTGGFIGRNEHRAREEIVMVFKAGRNMAGQEGYFGACPRRMREGA